MKTAIVYNPASGYKSTSADDIRQAFGNDGKTLVFIDIKLGIDKIRREIKKQKIQLIVGAGGDGTVNCVAQVASSESLPMGVLPEGTLNHFAKDLGLPLNLMEAAKVIRANYFKSIDYCSVNEHVFVNNSSIGLYPAAVKERTKLQPKLWKWFAATVATAKVALRLSTTHLGFELEGKTLHFKTPLVFVGNNSYHLEKIGFTNRTTLNEGKLFLYVVRANRASALLRQTILAFLGKRADGKDYLALTKHDLVVTSHKKQIKVAVDGEVLTIQPPLIYKIHPLSLKVAVSK